MQPRSLQQIISELSSTYDPQVASVQARRDLIPGQVASEEQGLQARQEQSFGDIVSGARRRGLGFSGIPLAEQARYTSTEFLPALARLRQSGREQAMSLEDAILGINERRNSQAQSIFEGERNFAEQQRQFNENLALQREQQRQAAAAASQNNSWLSALQGQQQAASPNVNAQKYALGLTAIRSLGFNDQVNAYRRIQQDAAKGDADAIGQLTYIDQYMPGLKTNATKNNQITQAPVQKNQSLTSRVSQNRFSSPASLLRSLF